MPEPFLNVQNGTCLSWINFQKKKEKTDIYEISSPNYTPFIFFTIFSEIIGFN